MVAFGYGVAAYEEAIPAGALQGLKVVAAAVVAQAVWGMARALCPDAARAHAGGARRHRGRAGALGGDPCSDHRGGRAGGPALPPPGGRRASRRARDRGGQAARGPAARALPRAADRPAGAGRRLAVRRADAGGRLLPLRLAGLRRRARAAAAAPGGGRDPQAGCRTRPSSPAMAPPRRCRGRSSPSPAISAWWRTSAPAGCWAACSAWARSLAPSFLLVVGAASFLGGDAAPRAGTAGHARRERSGGGAARRRLLRPDLDRRHPPRLPTSRSGSPPSCCSPSGRCRPGPWSSSARWRAGGSMHSQPEPPAGPAAARRDHHLLPARSSC